jgi:ABC-type Fe3+/spermidine/putrescine transport system ATPase subunit
VDEMSNLFGNHMSPARAKQNREIMKAKEVRYPFKHLQQYKGMIRPEEFEKVFPSIQFVRIPVHKAVYWMFETAVDMDLFKAWEKSHGN